MPSSSDLTISRRFAASLIVLALALCSLFLNFGYAQAETVDQGTCGKDVTWTLDDQGTLTVSGNGPMDNYSQEDWAPWTEQAKSIKSIVVSEGVTSIGNHAFWYCINATDASLPSSIASLGMDSFSQCATLTQITIPEGVTDIEGRAFNGCINLTNVALPNSLQNIKAMAFANCKALATITIPKNVTSLGNDAFNGCESLVDVKMPDSLTSLGDGVFANCTSLESITIPSSVASVPNSGFWGCTKLSSVKLQEGVTEICWGSFSDCPALTSLFVPRSVTSLEQGSIGMKYNYDTEQFDSVEGFVVYGYSGTAALNYAAKNGLVHAAVDSYSGGDCREVEVAGHSDSRTLTSFTGTQSGVTILLNGVTNENGQNLADAIAKHHASDAPVKFINPNFVDADKYSTIFHGYDSLHCWLSSASNTLLISGWSQGLTNPLLNQKFDSEDSVFIFLTSNMTDVGGAMVQKAYSYFFDGLYASLASGRSATPTTEATDPKPSVGINHKGFLPELCSDALLKTADISANSNAISILDDFGGHAYEMTLSGEGATHSVTVVGAVIEKDAAGASCYKALLIADSDNEVSSGIEQPGTMEEAYNARKSKTNSYTMYFLENHETRGAMRLCLKDYNGPGTYTPIDKVTSLAFRSETTYADALETAPNATEDASSTGDIALREVLVLDGDFQERNSFKTNEPITVLARVISLNDRVSFNAETAGSNILKNRLDIYRDGKLIVSLDKEATIDLTNAIIDAQTGEALNIDISKYCAQPGNYSIEFHLNSTNLPEAYVSNNKSPWVCTFDVVDSEIKPDPENDVPGTDNPNETNDGSDSQDTGKDSGDQDKTVLASTKDGFNPELITLIALATMTLAIVAARLRRNFENRN